MATLDETLKLEALPALAGSDQDHIVLKATSPSRSGLEWVAVPTDCVGLVYQIAGGGVTLQALQAVLPDDNNEGDSPSFKLLNSTTLAAPGVCLAASHDGRLVCVACLDGSLHCFDATTTLLEPRWTLSSVHSHVAATVAASPSTSRDTAASASGPLRSLAFQPSSYNLLLVDAGQQTLCLVAANKNATPTPRVVLDSSHQITCAAWAPDQHFLAVGKADGTIDIYEHASQDGLQQKGSLPHPTMEEDDEGANNWACTHLDWVRHETLAAGYCRVTPADDEADDEEEEDDSAEHEASFFIYSLHASNWTVANEASLGDIIAFFSVPAAGRHVFYSCHVATDNKEAPLVLVASNVSSDVGVVAMPNDEDAAFEVIDIPEGNNASAPTDDEDEFTYPIGIAAVTMPNGVAPRLLLSATDGSLCSWNLVNTENSAYFAATDKNATIMPAESVETVIADIPASGEEKAPAPAPALSPTESTPAPTGGSAATTTAPAFGVTSTLGFGTPPPASEMSASPAAAPIFGSGTSAPVFGSTSSNIFGSGGGFGSLAATASGSGAFGAPAASTPATAASPFDAFGSKKSGLSPAAALAKPLFGTPAPAPKEETKVEPPQEDKDDKPSQAAAKQAETTTTPKKHGDPPLPNDPNAKKAGAVYDLFDPQRQGKVPVSKLDDLLEDLGEGFAADELKQQIAIIDDKKTGFLERESFVRWYTNLLAAQGTKTKSATLELDEDDQEEWDEQKELVQTQFDEKGTGTTLKEEKFPDLIDGLGSTYCEEGEHGRARKKLAKNGMIAMDDFLEWYKNYLFGDDEDDEDYFESDEDTAVKPCTPEKKGWGDTFKVEEGSWQCAVCSVRNGPSQTQCESCETPRPASEDVAKDKTKAAARPKGPDQKQDKTGSSIGASGFTFGGADTKAAFGGGFSFGAASAGTKDAPPPKTAFSAPSGGFVFGGVKVDATTTAETTKSGSPAAKGDTIDMSEPLAKKAASAFDQCDPEKKGRVPVAKMEDVLDELGEGFHGEELEKQIALIDTEKMGFLDREPFIRWYLKLSSESSAATATKGDKDDISLDSDDQEEWEEQMEMVQTVFDEKGESGGKAIAEDQFPDLIDSLGSTYCEEGEHGRAKKKLAVKGMITIDAFLRWYKNYLFGDDEDGDEDDEEGDAAVGDEAGSAPTTSGWGNTFKVAEGSWKCAVCGTRNSADQTQCGPCEAPRPGAAAKGGKGSEQQAKPAGAGSSIGASGFTFGGAISGKEVDPSEEDKGAQGAAITTSGFSFGSTAKSGFNFSGTTAGQPGTGFSFGAPPKTETSSSVHNAKPASGGLFAAPNQSKPSTSSFGFSFAPSSGDLPTKGPDASLQPKAADPPSEKATKSPPVPAMAPTKVQPGVQTNSKGTVTATGATKLDATARKKEPSAGYPPVAAKAPSAFGSGSGTTKSIETSNVPSKGPEAATKESSASARGAVSSSYPPVASQAPPKFGQAAKPSAAVSKSAYPPTATRAPSSFGAAATAKPATTSSYPPTANRAPSSFGAASTAKPATASSSPPTPNKAPSSFGAASTMKAASTSAYPPTANRAPSSFGAAASARPATTSSYPPTPNKAPSSFGALAAKPAKTTSAYPPTANRAPSSFGTASSTKRASTSGYPPTPDRAPSSFGTSSTPPNPFSSAAVAKPAVPQKSSGYPPVATKAPSSFGASSSSAKVKPSSSGYPPTASKAPTMFGSPQPPTAPTAFGAATAPADSGRHPRLGSASQPVSRTSVGGISGSSSKYSTLVPEMERSLATVRFHSVAVENKETETLLSEMAKKRCMLFSSIADSDALAAEVRNSVPKFAAAEAQIRSKIEEMNRNLNEQSDSEALEKQSLDMESERIQRVLSSKGIQFVVRRGLLENRRLVWESLLDDDVSGMNAMLVGVHEEAKRLEADARAMREEAVKVQTSHALRSQSHSTQIVASKNPDGAARSWGEVDASCFKSIAPPKATSVSLGRSPQKPPAEHTSNLRSRAKGLTPLTAGKPRATPQRHTQGLGEPATFSPPQPAVPRSGWDKASTVDQTRAKRMVSSFPSDLRETSLEAEASQALRSYGTSAEGIRGVSASRGHAASSKQRPSSSYGSKLPEEVKPRQSNFGSPADLRVEQERTVSSTPVRTKRLTPARDEPSIKAESKLSGMSTLGVSLIGGNDKPGSKGDESRALAGMSLLSPKDLANDKADEQDYHAILTQFYEKHNPAKLPTVAPTLHKYKGREREMFAKLAQKYGDENPLESMSSKAPQRSRPAPSVTPSKPPASPSPFSTTPDGKTQGQAFGSSPFSSGPAMSQPAAAQQPSAFAKQSAAPTQIAPTPTAAPPAGASPMVGKSPRDMLYAFYQERNPSKLGEVDNLLLKYKGNEEKLFRNLAKKYNLDPSVFGIGSTPAFPSPAPPSGFGQHSPAVGGFGQAAPAPAVGGGFGQTSVLGSSPPGSAGGFGQPSVLGGGPSMASSPSPFGSPPAPSPGGGGFGFASPPASSRPAFGGGFASGSGGAGFGSLAQGAPGGSGFGSLAQSAPPNATFGQQAPMGFNTPFGGPRR